MALALCTMSLDLYLPTGGPAYRVPVTFEAESPAGSDGGFVHAPVTRYTDDLGHLEISLIQGLDLVVLLSGRRLHFTVPEEESANLLDYLLPYITDIEVVVEASGEVGEVLRLSATATYSNGDEDDVSSSMTYASSDTNIATVNGRSLTLLSSGATTVTVSGVAEGKEIPSPEDNLELAFLRVPHPSYVLGNGVVVEVS